MSEVQKTAVVYHDKQGGSFLEKNRKVGICHKHIDIHHHFMRDMVGDKDTDIEYIRSKENPTFIMTNNCSEDENTKHLEITTE